MRRKDEGFTLIELMIVIAVIGILAVVLMPKMTGLKTGAKITGVQTNAVSVQAYVVSGMDKWINKNLSDAAITTAISAQFSGDNALKNPLSGLTTHSTDIVAASTLLTQTNSSGVAQTPAITGTVAKTDALQILSAAPTATPYTAGAGTVVVVVSSPATNGIQIIGYDDKGNVVDSALKVNP